MEELQKKNDADLTKHITEKREELRKLRFSSSGSGMRDTHAQRNVRREIARGLTLLNERNKKAGEKNS